MPLNLAVAAVCRQLPGEADAVGHFQNSGRAARISTSIGGDVIRSGYWPYE